MADRPSLVANVAWTMGARALSQVLSYLTFLVIAHRLGDTGVGQYTFVYATLGLGAILCHPGLEGYLVRELGQRPADAPRLAMQALMLKAALSVLSFGATLAWVSATGKDHRVLVAAGVAAITHALQALDAVPSALLVAEERMGLIAFAQVLERGGALAGVAALLTPGRDVVAVCTALLASTIASTLVHLAGLRGRRWEWAAPDLAVLRRMSVDALPFGLTQVFLYVYFRIDSVMLSMISGDAATGVYSVADRTLEAVLFLPSAILAAVYPRLVRQAAEDEDGYLETAGNTLDVLVRLAIPAVVGLVLVSRGLIELLYGPAFAGSAPILSVLALALFFAFFNTFLGLQLNARRQEQGYAAVAGAAALFNIVLNAILIPGRAGIGAAWATAASELFCFLCFVRLLAGVLPRIFRWRVLAQAVGASALMAAALVHAPPLPVLAQVLVGVAVYGLATGLAMLAAR